MIVEEERKHEVVNRINTKIICDVCKKTIAEIGGKGRHFYELTTGHHEWGNDSVDSIEQFEICSDECLRVKFEEYLKDRYDTSYFDVSSDHSNYYLKAR